MAFHHITATDHTYLNVPARVVTAYAGPDEHGERVIVTQWGAGGRYPAGTITYQRITGDGRTVNGDGALKVINPERVVTKQQLSPQITQHL